MADGNSIDFCARRVCVEMCRGVVSAGASSHYNYASKLLHDDG